MNSGNPFDTRRQAWGSPLSCTSEPVLSSVQPTQHSSQGATIHTVQGRLASSAGSQPRGSLLTRVDSAESTETGTMTTEQATASTVIAAVTAKQVAMATSVPSPQGAAPPSPPPSDNLSGVQPIKAVRVIVLDEPKKKEWDSILPKDPESLQLRMKILDYMHRHKERKEAQRQQAVREWHAERMRQVAHMCATGVFEPSLFFPPQQVPTAVPWARESNGLLLNRCPGVEAEHLAAIPSSGPEQYQPLVQSDGHAVETILKDSHHPTAVPTYQPRTVLMPSTQVVTPTPLTAPPPPATTPPPAAQPQPAATPPPTATPPPPPPSHQPPPVDVALLANIEQV